MSEYARTSLLIEAKPPADNGLWPVFDAINSRLPENFDLLTPKPETTEAARESFFNTGRRRNPDLRPDKVDIEDLRQKEIDLLDFKDSVKNDSNTNPIVAQAYRWRVNEAIANIRMVNAGVGGDMRRFNAYNRYVYGSPDPKIFAATADWFRQYADSLSSHESPQISSAAKAVIETVPDQGGNKDYLAPSPEVFAAVRDNHFREGGYFALLLTGVKLPETGKVSQEVGDKAVRQVLANIGSDLRLMDSTGASWSIDRTAGAVRRPAVYNWVIKRFIGLPLGHEVGSHELEFQNGIRQPLRLFASGLDRTENGNEGRAVIREQLPYENFEAFSKLLRWQDIMRRHFAISLAEGLATGERMTFSEVFAVMNTVDRLWERSRNPEDIEAADTKADKRTWDLLAGRIFRGTDGTGGAYLKDKLYLEGNVACWKLAEIDPSVIEQGDLGKFDITNPRHIFVACATGVLPKVEW